jgi:hypothetical protein
VDREALLEYIDAAIRSGETGAAWRVQSVLFGEPPLLVNGDFATPLLNRGFDWKPAATAGVGVARTQDRGPALAIEFSGREPESCELLSHALALRPGTAYVLRFEYRTVDFLANSGISWRLGNQMGAALAASAGWKQQEWRFRAATQSNLELVYGRAPGTMRAEGRLFLRNARIEAAPL